MTSQSKAASSGAPLGQREDQSLYANAFGFLRQPLNFDPVGSAADVVITGIPFDLATTGRSGARFGPEAIRKASVNLAWEGQRWPWFYDLTRYLSIVDCGDLVFECGSADDMSRTLLGHASRVIDADKRLLTFGGDHFVTLPLLRAHAKKYGSIALVHFDAHTDDYDMGGAFDHGTMFYHAQKEGLIDTSASVQLGIRTTYDYKNTPFTVLDARYVNSAPVDNIVDNICRAVGERPVYLTFDIDCLDPAFAPGTGTPVCGGLTTDRALNLLRGLQGLDIIGMDLVEVSPAYDHADITALAGATIALEMLYLQAELKQAELKRVQ